MLSFSPDPDFDKLAKLLKKRTVQRKLKKMSARDRKKLVESGMAPGAMFPVEKAKKKAARQVRAIKTVFKKGK